MTAAWIATAAAVLAMVGPYVRDTRLAGKREGKIDAVLEQLAALTEDHETRLRRLEHEQHQSNTGVTVRSG